MTEYPRRPFDEAAYLDRVRAACFVCELLSGNPEYRHDVAYRDADAVVFLSRPGCVLGHLLVAPVRHVEHAVGDFAVGEYLRLQRVVHAAGQAVAATVPTERLYVLSLGSQQGNRHVHWHVAPLPPGVPYAEQQLAAMSLRRGYLDVPPEVSADLAARIGAHLRRELA